MKLYIGSDHAGYELKEKVKKHLADLGHEVVDAGPDSADRVDYPVYGAKVGRMVVADPEAKGIVICGSGIGISIAANKVDGVRCALCNDPLCAKLCRQHNDANILSMGARIVGEAMAYEIVENFLTAEFEGGRHAGRVELIHAIEKEQ
ncbi:MAG: ribose 5-phosphate isomerase B [Firmicutes bacterium]|nr:ribose 5-phosphate isomerase B [Bacillota bacterium]